MKVFVDSGAWIALLDSGDSNHDRACRMYAQLRQRKSALRLSDYVFDETATWLRYHADHRTALTFGCVVLSLPRDCWLLVDEPVREAAWQLFEKYSDQALSFTDCTSFVLMRKHRMREAFTYDKHFKMMGFDVLA